MFITFLLLFAVGLILFQAHRNNQNLLHEQTKTSSYLITHQILSLNHSDSGFISEMLFNTFGNQKDVSKVLIYSDEGKFMGGYVADAHGTFDPSIYHLEKPESAGSQFQIVHSLVTPDNSRRYVYVQYTQDTIFQSLKFLLVLMGMLFLLIEATIVLLFQRGFLSPLGRMVSNIGSIGSGKISDLKPLKGDEPFENIYKKLKLTDKELFSSKKELDSINRDAFIQNRELTETETRLRLIMDNSVDGVFTLNNSGEIDYINIACEDLLQYPSEELEGQSLKAILPEDTQKGQNKLIHYLSEENTTNTGFREELICKKKDDSLFTGLVSIIKVDVESHYIFVGSIRDISHYKEKENNLQHAALMAEEQIRAKSESIVGMANEFRDPMEKIMKISEQLENEKLDDSQKDLIHNLMESSQSLREVLNNLLDQSTIESGKMKIEKSYFDIVQLIEDTTHGFTPSLKQKKLDLFLTIQPEVPKSILGDPNRFKHAFTNLISNAVKYTNKGYIQIQVDYFPQSNSLEIAVIDTGIGMNQKTIENLFEQTEGSASSAKIGMSVTKELIQLMNGKLLVSSDLGNGSTFRIILKDIEIEPVENSPFRLNGARVLVGPTNSNIFSEIKNHVGFYGGEAVIASNMEDCLHYLKNAKEDESFQAVLLDEQREGLKIANAIKKQNLSLGLDTIIFSWNRWKAENKEEEQPFDFWLPKPLKISKMMERLRQNMLEPNESKADENGENNSFDLKILIVEDNSSNQLVLKKILEKMNCQVEIANHGLEALMKRKEDSFDIIFMDIHMPELDGYATTAKIRSEENPETHQTIIAMTAHSSEESREKCLDIGMDDYMTKPLSRSIIIEMLQKWGKKASFPEPDFSDSMSHN